MSREIHICMCILITDEPSVPPPPALEEILKAEMELDRQSRLKIESAADERLILEENEIMQKEREIIESLESEERQKQLFSESIGCYSCIFIICYRCYVFRLIF